MQIHSSHRPPAISEACASGSQATGTKRAWYPLLLCMLLLLLSGCCWPQQAAAAATAAGARHERRTKAAVVPLLRNLRILVSISAFLNNRPQYLERAMTQLVQACELGANISIILHTAVMWDGSAIVTPGFRHCNRLLSDLPLSIDRQEFSIGLQLTGRHRQFFAQRLNDFDLFVYMEDDLDFKVSHLMLLVAQSKRLHHSKLVPGLLRFEAMKHPEAAPNVSFPYYFPDQLFPARVLKHQGTLYYSQWNVYYAMYLLPRERLRALMGTNTTAWVHQLSQVPYMTREFYGGFWLDHLYKVVPVHSIPSAMLHHLPNNYAPDLRNITGSGIEQQEWYPYTLQALFETLGIQFDFATGKVVISNFLDSCIPEGQFMEFDMPAKHSDVQQGGCKPVKRIDEMPLFMW